MPDNYTKEVSGYFFHKDTPDALCAELVRLKDTRARVRLDYGDTATGISWEESYDVTGYIGSSMGPKRVMILVHNARSSGGLAVLTNCILSIRLSAKPHTVLYTI